MWEEFLWMILLPLLGVAAYSLARLKVLMWGEYAGRYERVLPFEEEDFNYDN
tara:strand:+ start:354 stop:509 length:156 start_codon:yes stop_codon:yes gene_type:complete